MSTKRRKRTPRVGDVVVITRATMQITGSSCGSRIGEVLSLLCDHANVRRSENYRIGWFHSATSK